jgi:hypothetical protein
MAQPQSGGKGKPGGGHGTADALLQRLVDLERKKGNDGAEGWDVFEFRASGAAQVSALRCAARRAAECAPTPRGGTLRDGHGP